MRALLIALAAAALAGCTQTLDSEPVATQEIRIPGQWVFQPEVAQVVAGQPVTWTNDGAADHTVTIPELGIDETIPPGGNFTHTFQQPGTYDYDCKLHPPGMVGRIVVVAAPQDA